MIAIVNHLHSKWALIFDYIVNFLYLYLYFYLMEPFQLNFKYLNRDKPHKFHKDSKICYQIFWVYYHIHFILYF